MGRPWHDADQVYFISSKGRSSAHVGGTEEKQDFFVSLLGQTSTVPAAVAMGPAAVPTAPQTRGTENPVTPGPGADPGLVPTLGPG